MLQRETHTHHETELRNIQRVNQVRGIEHIHITNPLISPSNSLVGNKVCIRFYKYNSKTFIFHLSFLIVPLSIILNFLIRFTLTYSESIYLVAYWDIPSNIIFLSSSIYSFSQWKEWKKRGYLIRGSIENIGRNRLHTNVANVDDKNSLLKVNFILSLL